MEFAKDRSLVKVQSTVQVPENKERMNDGDDGNQAALTVKVQNCVREI